MYATVLCPSLPPPPCFHSQWPDPEALARVERTYMRYHIMQDMAARGSMQLRGSGAAASEAAAAFETAESTSE